MTTRFGIILAVVTLTFSSSSTLSSQVCFGCPTPPQPPKQEIRDGDWSIRIVIAEGVDRTAAELIVRAFHRDTLVDFQNIPAGDDPAGWRPPTSQADKIYYIRRTSPQENGRDKSKFTEASYANLLGAEGLYLVTTSDGLASGRDYFVGIRDGKVELFLSWYWIA